MKKEKGSSLKQGIVLLCAASILLVGCSEKETGSEQPGIAPMEQTGGESGNTHLSEKYRVELEQPEPNFEEYTVRLLNGTPPAFVFQL